MNATQNQLSDQVRESLRHSLGALVTACYQGSASKGFWNDYERLRDIVGGREPDMVRPLEKMMFAQKLALIVSEAAEALEGNRKDSPSDKIIGFSAEEEELADTVIRICDLSGRQGLRLADAIIAKLDMNAGRPYMHGKQY